MKELVIQVGYEDFMVYFEKQSDLYWRGKVAQLQIYDDGYIEFQSNHSSDSTDKLDDARIWFEWSFCWRGVWEGRIYFKDDEYWSEEMQTIPLIWNQIEDIIKDKIKNDNPDRNNFD